jgi:hypothetical protein
LGAEINPNNYNNTPAGVKALTSDLSASIFPNGVPYGIPSEISEKDENAV